MKSRSNTEFMIHRTKKSSKFTILDNSLLLDTRLSFRARMVMAIVVSLPDKWNFSVAGFVKISGESEYIVRNAMAELEKWGYLVQSRARDEKGRVRQAVYSFYEAPRVVGEEVVAVAAAEVPAGTVAVERQSPGGYGKRGKGRRGKFQNYEGRKWNYEYLELMEKAKLFGNLGREEEAEILREKARACK